MTLALETPKVLDLIQPKVSEAALEPDSAGILVDKDHLVEVMAVLRNDPDFRMDYLIAETAVDYPEYFELLYHLVSTTFNHSLVVKSRIHNKLDPEIASMFSLWKTADFQEREIWDLMGIKFTDHPELRRILLWEGFPGHPLRKDFLWVEREVGPLIES